MRRVTSATKPCRRRSCATTPPTARAIASPRPSPRRSGRRTRWARAQGAASYAARVRPNAAASATWTTCGGTNPFARSTVVWLTDVQHAHHVVTHNGALYGALPGAVAASGDADFCEACRENKGTAFHTTFATYDYGRPMREDPRPGDEASGAFFLHAGQRHPLRTPELADIEQLATNGAWQPRGLVVLHGQRRALHRGGAAAARRSAAAPARRAAAWSSGQDGTAPRCDGHTAMGLAAAATPRWLCRVPWRRRHCPC